MRPFAFPRIPHLPGSHAAPDDLVLTEDEATEFFRGEILVMEKMDGLNVALSMDHGWPRAELKFDWVGAAGGAVERAIGAWAFTRRRELARLLDGGHTLYGEWLWHTVSVHYAWLDDAFQGFGLRAPDGRMVPPLRALQRIRAAGLHAVTPLWRGEAGNWAAVRRLVGRSRQGRHRMEGLILEHAGPHAIPRAKWVEHGYRHVPPGTLDGRRNTLRVHGT